MLSHFSKLNYKQKGLIAELSYLFVIGILSPFCVGLQTWSQDKIPNSLGYVVINILQLPVIILFYRLYLPQTVGKKRYGLFAVLLPVYIFLYGLSERLGIGAVMVMPFILEAYRHAISGARPWDFTQGYFNTDIGYTFLILLAGTALYVIKLLFKNQHQLLTLETEKLRLELKHLKSQVQPHFFFNTLNNLYALSVKKSSKTSAMIADLSAIMRYVLYETEHGKVPLEKELNFINSYVQLERIRHDDPNLIDFAVQGNPALTEIEPLLFLPLIENAFKHALQKDLPGKYVKIALVVDDDELVFQTSNPKQKADIIQKKTNEGGIGLKNVKKRLELLYPDSHQLEIDSTGETFNVILTIKFKQ